MSSYYIAKRNRYIFTTETSKSFKVSRSKAQHYGIQYDVLDKLGDLTANKDDNITARKFKPPPKNHVVFIHKFSVLVF